MGNFVVEFETENAAFAKDKGFEVARILKLVAAKVEAGDLTGSILDLNGNTVGTFIEYFTETEG
jgi:hypothetical protein